MKAVIEGLLFVVGDVGIDDETIANIMEISKEQANSLINELKEDYNNDERGLTIKKLGGLYKLTTKNEHKKYYSKLAEISNIKNLSQSALETLAIIAYNEPITRTEIDELRGVNSSQMLRNLSARDFIQEVGRSEKVGRPILYGITKEFLDYFGLETKDNLPKIEEVKGVDDEVDLYKSKYTEEKDEIEQL